MGFPLSIYHSTVHHAYKRPPEAKVNETIKAQDLDPKNFEQIRRFIKQFNHLKQRWTGNVFHRLLRSSHQNSVLDNVHRHTTFIFEEFVSAFEKYAEVYHRYENAGASLPDLELNLDEIYALAKWYQVSDLIEGLYRLSNEGQDAVIAGMIIKLYC